MSYYALAVVPEGWNEHMPLTFSQAQYDSIRDSVVAGTHLILFRGAPDNVIIGQGQTPGTFIRTSEWPKANLGSVDPSNPNQAYLLPIEVVLLLKGTLGPKPLAQVHEALGETSFPVAGEVWRSITDDQYDALRDGWT